MKTLSIFTTILVGAASAQSLDSLELASASNGADGIGTDNSTDAKKAELISLPSRYAGLDVDAYLEALSASFAMRTRARDPFGRHQDPNFKAPEPAVSKPTIAKYKPKPVTPFPQIVEAIPITAIIPSQGKFLVGNRTCRVGERIHLTGGDSESLTVHVVEIAANRVTFRHGVTNETADHVLKILPGGMIRGGGEDPPAGVVPADTDTTIDISGGMGPSGSAQPRPGPLSSRR